MSHHPMPIAIVGMASLFPKAPSLSAYWRNILDAADCISEVPADHSWDPADHHSDDPNAKDKTWCSRGGFLDKIPFDPIEFGIPPNMLESIDTTQLLSLIVAREALIDAGMSPDDDAWDRERVACILGITGTQEMAVTLGSRLFGPTWRKALKRCGVNDQVAEAVVQDIGAHLPTWTEQSFPGLLGNVVTGRISNRFNLGGTNAVVDAACASSLAAMQYALSDLTSYRSDVVLTGGADCLNDTFMYQCFTRTPAFTKKGDATPFDANSDGILIGEGIGIVACKRLEDAERDGDRIYAVIRGLGSSSDGRFKSIYAPNPDGQAKCLNRAYAMADVDPGTVELIEAHGTGTKAGDAAEIQGLKQVFGAVDRDDRWIQVGTVKSQIGHTKSTAGAAGLIKAALALHHRVLPPTAKVDTPNPKMGLEDSPFFLSPHARPWIRSADHPRRAGVSAFGFGGTNYHCVLEEYGDPNATTQLEPARSELFLIEGTNAASLNRALDALDGETFSHAARASQAAFTGKKAHIMAFATTQEDFESAKATARVLLAKGPGSRSDVHYGVNPSPGKVAFVFPGQGSQYVEMGRDLAVRWPVVRAALDAADEHFRTHDRTPLSKVTFPPPYEDADAHETRLRQTEWAQPAIGALSKGMFDLLKSFGLEPDAVAGHSYGELVALHAAGVLDIDGLWTASRVRGEAMAGAPGERGTMAAVSGKLDAIQAVLTPLRKVLLANRNHPEQGVISGTDQGVERALEALEKAGLTAKRIPVSAAFHSPMVGDAAAPFAAALKNVTFKAPKVPVYANSTAKPYPKSGASCRRQLGEQITQPVDWVGIVEAMVADGVKTFIEVGPKGVLTTLVRKTLSGQEGITVVPLDRQRHRMDGDQQLKGALAQLAAAGVSIDLSPLLSQPLPPVPVKPRSKASVGLNGANYRNESTKNPPVTPQIEAARKAQHPAPARPVTATPKPAAPAQTTSPVSKPKAAQAPRPPRPTAPPAVARTPRKPGKAMSTDLTALLESTRATLAAFQSTQERTAAVHAEFLKAHAEANASFSTLFQTHARLVELATTGESTLPLPALPAPRPSVAAAMRPAPAAPPRSATPIADTQAMSANTHGMASMMSTEAATLVSSFLGQGHKTPATQKLEGLSGAANVAAANDIPPLMDARNQPIQSNPTARAVPPTPVEPPAAAKGPNKSAVVDAMLASVAEKTGYPIDMLELGMDLEADLGIDSIKRVEILSAVQDKVPGLPELDNDALSALRTLQDVTDYLAEVSGASVAPAAANPAPVATSTGPAKTAVVDAMFASVAEKTGYPIDMLELGMDLEADLGIDSIKRVEILSAVQDKVPGLPELDNDALSALRTLQEVTDYLAEVSGASDSAPAVSAAGTAGPAIQDAMFASVAEKTGYPVDMLEMSMDLEADLGIDSIKRVEILSAVQDKVPGLPELDNDALSALRTLQEVVDYLARVSGAPASAVTAPAVPTEAPIQLLRRELRLVPCVDGIPAPPQGRIAVTADKKGRAKKLVDALQKRGVDAFLIAPDWSGELNAKADGAIHMATLGATGDDLLERVRGAFLLAKALGPVKFFATVSGMGGDFGLSKCKQPLEGGLAGLPKTLDQEWEGRFLALDIDPSLSAGALADALIADRGAVEIGVTKKGVFRLHNAVATMPSSDHGAPCEPGDLVVVSGGARGVTAAVVIEMATRYQPSFLLLGRSAVADTDPVWAQGVADEDLKTAWMNHARAQGEKPTPKAMTAAAKTVAAAREVRATLAAIADAGSTVQYASVDIRDADAVQDAIEAMDRPVAGIVHGAGVLADKLVTAKTPEQFDFVFSTKVDGLDALLGATDKNLKFAVMFASVAGRYGNIGQCDYAMANEVLTHTGLQLAQRGVRVKSFDWGPWEAGMVTPGLRKQFEERGLTVIPLDLGAAFCCDELERGGEAVEIVVEGPRPQTGSVSRVLALPQHPYLVDHSIEGTPVVPVAMVLEWFADAAKQVWPSMHIGAVEDFAVLKGIALDTPTEFTLSWEPTDAQPGELALSMRLGTETRAHYRAVVRMVFEAPVAAAFPGSNGLGKQTWTTEPYGKWLFHGPTFQGIDEIVGYSDHGIVGWLNSSTPSSMGMGGTRWTTDPLTIDCALQLMLLWVGETQGTRALPCGIKSFQQYKSFEGRVACHLEMEGADANHGHFQATFVDESGDVVATLDAGEYAARR